jgi:regulator of sigma E protease
MFYFIEGLTGRPLAEKFQDYAFKLGLAFIITLMVFTTANDVWQVFIK